MREWRHGDGAGVGVCKLEKDLPSFLKIRVESSGHNGFSIHYIRQVLKGGSVNFALRLFSIFVFCFSAIAAVAQQDFSADMVDITQGKAPTTKAKIYATKDKLRIEPEGDEKAVMIVNLSTQTSYGLMPERKMYMEFNQSQGPAAQYWSRALFRPSDVEDSCSAWLKLPSNRGGTCKKVGNETVNGRSTVKFEGTNAKGETGYAWVDRKIGFPIKMQGNGQESELQNIKEGPQPASLFEVPAGYQKFQMPAGMQNMQRPR